MTTWRVMPSATDGNLRFGNDATFVTTKPLVTNVIYVTDTDPQMSDESILDWAVVSGRIIVTTDNDFELNLGENSHSY